MVETRSTIKKHPSHDSAIDILDPGHARKTSAHVINGSSNLSNWKENHGAEYRQRREWYKDQNQGKESKLRPRKKKEFDEEDYRQRRIWYKEWRETGAEEVNLIPKSPRRIHEEWSLEGVRFILLLLLCTVTGLCTWFSAGAVLPQLQEKWAIGPDLASLLTIMVNLGLP